MKNMLKSADISAIAEAVAEKMAESVADAVAEAVTEKMKLSERKLLNVEQVADMLGKTPSAVKKMCQRKQLPAHHFHGAYYFEENEILDNILDKR